VERARTTIKRFNDDLNGIMERNHEYLYKRETSSKQNKLISTEDVLKTLEMMKESNCKILLADSADVAKVRANISLAAEAHWRRLRKGPCNEAQ
jgi:hypothetical protein